MRTSRRRFLAAAGAAAAFGPALRTAALGSALEPLEVAYAGSMASVMDGAIKGAVAAALGLDFRGRAQGANALAQEIAGGSLRPDVFIAITAEPMQIVLRAGKASGAVPVAHTAMVVAYAPRGRFAPDFARAGQPGSRPWWAVLQEPGLRFGRTDPRTDPQGRNIIYVCELAERFYRQPGLAARILGPTLNPSQIFAETMVEARLQSGELDAASAYRVQPGPFHLPTVKLPPEINLGGPLPPFGAGLKLTLDGHAYRPEPLIYYAAAISDAPHPRAAQRFVGWLQGPAAQALLGKYGYDAPGTATPLTA